MTAESSTRIRDWGPVLISIVVTMLAGAITAASWAGKAEIKLAQSELDIRITKLEQHNTDNDKSLDRRLEGIEKGLDDIKVDVKDLISRRH